LLPVRELVWSVSQRLLRSVWSSPPEAYLRCKYGPNWGTPKQVGYEKDVLDAMPKGTVPGRAGWLKQLLAVRFSPRQTATLLVLDGNDAPVAGAGVLLAGLSQSKTNRQGIGSFICPGQTSMR
jgi:hypothetical protein